MEFTGKMKVKKNVKGMYYTSIRRKAPEGSEKPFEYAVIGVNFLDKSVSLEDGSWINVKNGFLSFYKFKKEIAENTSEENQDEEIRFVLVVTEYESAPKPIKQDTSFNYTMSEENDELPF